MTESEVKILQALQEDLASLRAKQDNASARVWDIATKLSVPVIISVVGWLWSLDRSVQSNTHDISDHSAHLETMDRRIDSLPPQWLRDIVSELKAQNISMIQRLSSLEATLKAMGDK